MPTVPWNDAITFQKPVTYFVLHPDGRVEIFGEIFTQEEILIALRGLVDEMKYNRKRKKK